MHLSQAEMELVRTHSKDEAAYEQLCRLLESWSAREFQITHQLEEQYHAMTAALHNAQTLMMTRISHEFRTPLAIVITSCELLERYFDRLDTDKRHHHLHKIRVQVHRIAGMLDDIIAVMRGMAHFTHPQLTEIALDELYVDVQQRVTMTSGMHHHCYFNMTGTRRHIMADENLLHAIMMVLLSNAIKYSPDQSVIEFNLHFGTLEEGITFQVKNSGMGILPDGLPHIFEAYYRGENTSATSGLGLGLNLVKQIVTLYNGSITVESQPEDTTTFVVWLPL
jgi:signal transduction histidine kinase